MDKKRYIKKKGAIRNKFTYLFTVVFVMGILGLQGKAFAYSSMTTISGPSSFDTPSLLASLVYTNMGNNTVQESLQVSSFGNYPSDENADKANQSYGSLTAPSSGTSLNQGKALQSYIYTLDAMGLEGKLYSQGENPPDVAVNGDSYAYSNSQLFSKKDDKVKVLWHKTKTKTFTAMVQSFLFDLFNSIGSFFAGFCDLANKLVDKFVDIYMAIPALFATGKSGSGLLFDILNGIASLFGVSSFFSMVRQLIAPYAFGGIIISIGVAGMYLMRPRPQYRSAISSVWHVMFRLIMFISGFALLGWAYTTIVSPVQTGFSDVTTKMSSLNDPKGQSIDALAWGISSNFSLDSSVTGVSIDQSQLTGGKVQSALIDNPTVISNINQRSIDILGKSTLSAISSPLQYSGDFTKSSSPYRDEWNQTMNQTSAGTFSYEDYLNGLATAMKANNKIEAMNNPLTNNNDKQLVAGGYFGDSNYFYSSKYGVNNFNTKTYLFIANPKSGYEGSTSDGSSSPEGETSGTLSVTLSNPADGNESLKIENLSKNKPFWAIPVEVTNPSSYLFGAVPAQSMTTQTSATYTGLSQDMEFADIASMNKQGTYLTQDSQGNISGITSTQDKHLRNNAYQIVLMNKEAGVNPATASNNTYFQFSTQSALFFLNSEMTSSGALNFSFPNGINFTGSQGNSTKEAYFNRMISISAGSQASNVVSNSFKFLLYALVFLSIIVALLNTAFLKKVVENVLSYVSFLGSGHLVDFVAGTTMALAFCFLKISAHIGVAVGSVVYTATNKFLMGLFHTDTSEFGVVLLWSVLSTTVTIFILFMPVIPNAHSLLSGNPVRQAKDRRKAFQSGREMAVASGNVGGVAVASALGLISWIGNKLACSLPAVIVIMPIVIQRMLMEAIASPLVAVQNGDFIGKSSSFGKISKSLVHEKVNKKIGKSKVGDLGVHDLSDKFDPTTGKGRNITETNGIANVGKGIGGKKNEVSKGKGSPLNGKGGKSKIESIGKDGEIGKKKNKLGDNKDKLNKKNSLVDTSKMVDPKTGKLVKDDDWERKEELLTDEYMKDGLVWANAKNQAKKDIENEKSRREVQKAEQIKDKKEALSKEKARIAKVRGVSVDEISDDEANKVLSFRAKQAQKEVDKKRISDKKAELKKTPLNNKEARKEVKKQLNEARNSTSVSNLTAKDRIARNYNNAKAESIKNKLRKKKEMEELMKTKEALKSAKKDSAEK